MIDQYIKSDKMDNNEPDNLNIDPPYEIYKKTNKLHVDSINQIIKKCYSTKFTEIITEIGFYHYIYYIPNEISGSDILCRFGYTNNICYVMGKLDKQYEKKQFAMKLVFIGDNNKVQNTIKQFGIHKYQYSSLIINTCDANDDNNYSDPKIDKIDNAIICYFTPSLMSLIDKAATYKGGWSAKT